MIKQKSISKVSRDKLETTLNKIYNIPALPDIVAEALRLLNSSMTNNRQLIKIISKEQSFVAKVLAIANSPIYGLRKEVSTIDFAIMVLGHNELRHIVFVISFLESFKGNSDKYFSQNSFWLHSLLTANIARRISEENGYEKSGEAFVSGFLHDFGVSIMHRHFRSSFISINDLVKNEGMSFADAELSVLGISHTEIAKYLMDNWSFPANLKNAAANHHNPLKAEEDKLLPAIVHMADFIACEVNQENNVWDKGVELKKGINEIFGKSEDEFEEFLQTYLEKFKNSEEFIGLIS